MSAPSKAALMAGATALRMRAARLRAHAADPATRHDARKVCKRAAEVDLVHAQELELAALERTQEVGVVVRGAGKPVHLRRRQAG